MSLQCSGSTVGAQGFTLLELLVAVSIFSLLAAGSYGLLQTLATTKDATAERAEEVAGLQLFHALLRADLMQLSMSPETGEATWTQEESRLEFNRASMTGEAGAVAVLYALEPSERIDELPRLIREVRGATLLGRDVLSEDVAEMEFRYLNGGGTWSREWPADPVAVEVRLLHSRIGEMTTLYGLPKGWPPVEVDSE